MSIPLVEPSEREVIRKIRRRVLTVEEVKECKEVRMAFTRKKPYVYLHVWLKGNPGYEGIHKICSTIEREVRRLIPNARVAIRSEPYEIGTTQIWSLVKKIVEGEPGSRGAHNIHVQNLKGKVGVDFHLEVSAGLTVKQAHEISTRIEKKIKAEDPNISEVVIHEESVHELVSSERLGHGTEVRWYVEHVVKRFPDLKLVRPPTIRQMADHLHVIIRAAFSPGTSIEKANEITSRLDAAIRDGYPAIARVDITQEPLG
ncbi:MAG: hypothetical protein JRN52_14270 [Nitrososphaerota archaeon]|nr:hypothetical protein [Nitrososphaerota archaeon]